MRGAARTSKMGLFWAIHVEAGASDAEDAALLIHENSDHLIMWTVLAMNVKVHASAARVDLHEESEGEVGADGGTFALSKSLGADEDERLYSECVRQRALRGMMATSVCEFKMCL